MIWTYIIIAVLLLAAELAYFRIADKCNIIDKPNERSSHTTIVLRGGGVIFAISMLVWFGWQMVQGEWLTVQGYLPFLVGLIMIATVSFWDDVHSLPDSLRMAVQIIATLLMFWSIGLYGLDLSWWLVALIVVVALFFCVGATNFINFMDGINGITAAYSFAMLLPIPSGFCGLMAASILPLMSITGRYNNGQKNLFHPYP
jgi:UDP-N-acetylmuramyl pentapeptide phosphotransferase/UDP-N-acetylglucosamine-1-phosphate transferase